MSLFLEALVLRLPRRRHLIPLRVVPADVWRPLEQTDLWSDDLEHLETPLRPSSSGRRMGAASDPCVDVGDFEQGWLRLLAELRIESVGLPPRLKINEKAASPLRLSAPSRPQRDHGLVRVDVDTNRPYSEHLYEWSKDALVREGRKAFLVHLSDDSILREGRKWYLGPDDDASERSVAQLLEILTELPLRPT